MIKNSIGCYYFISKTVCQSNVLILASIKLYMIYNDFQILTDGQYANMNFAYKNEPKPTTQDLVNKLFLSLDNCKSYCFGLDKTVNKNIQKVLIEARIQLDRLMGNINAMFKVEAHTMQAINSFNIFRFAKNIIETIGVIDELLESLDTKRQPLTAMSKTLTDIAYNLFDALEKSNIHLFKHM